METTPTGRGSDLPTILDILRTDQKSRSVNICFQQSDLDPTSRTKRVLPAKAPPSLGVQATHHATDLAERLDTIFILDLCLGTLGFVFGQLCSLRCGGNQFTYVN